MNEYSREDKAMDSKNTDELKKENQEEARKHRALPKIHTLTNREMNAVAGGHIHWDKKLHSNFTATVC